MCLEPITAAARTGPVGEGALEPCPAARSRAAQRDQLERIGFGKKKEEDEDKDEDED